MEKFLKDIDFNALRGQKKTLNGVIAELIGKGEEFRANKLEGIVNLIDKIQDIAVDEYGYKESEVFDLTEEKKS